MSATSTSYTRANVELQFVLMTPKSTLQFRLHLDARAGYDICEKMAGDHRRYTMLIIVAPLASVYKEVMLDLPYLLYHSQPLVESHDNKDIF